MTKYDKKWDTKQWNHKPIRKQKSKKNNPDTDLCRVLPFRLANNPVAFDWLINSTVTRIKYSDLYLELNKAYAELSSLLKEKFNC